MANRRKPAAEEAATVPTQPALDENTATEEGQENVELTVNDLAALKQIIDIASSRGSFRPNEMVAIGTTYARLENFLTVVSQQQQANGQQAQ